MTKDYAFKEGFIDLQLWPTGRFLYRLHPAVVGRWSVVERKNNLGQNVGDLVDTEARTLTLLDTVIVGKYSVKKENVVEGFESIIGILVPTAEDDPDLI